jgi:hypothetical protein
MDDHSQIDLALQRRRPETKDLYNFNQEDIPLSVDPKKPKLKDFLENVSKQRKNFQQKRKISKKLVNKCSDIKRLGYGDLFPQLSQIVDLTQKPSGVINVKADDEMILTAVYQYLANAFGEIKYSTYHKILGDYDYILKNDPSYRDHLFHTFHVFMIGCIIIDELYDELSKRYDSQNKIPGTLHNIEYSWLIISNFHDIGIPIQNAEKMIRSLTGNFYSVDKKSKYLDIISLLCEKDRKKINSNIEDMLKLTSSNLKKPVKKPVVFHCQCHEQIYKLNHAILGSTFLIKSMTKKDKSNGSNSKKKMKLNDIKNLGLPIFIHDYNIWKHFPRKSISLFDFPLGFILIFCDNIQDFNRTNELNEQFKGYVKILKIDYYKREHRFIVELGFSERSCYERKCALLKNVINVLDSDPIDFQIKLVLLERRKIVDKTIFSTLEKYEITKKDKEFYRTKDVNC